MPFFASLYLCWKSRPALRGGESKPPDILKTNDPERIRTGVRKRGGQPGNRNAQKTGQFNREARSFRRDVRLLILNARATIARADASQLPPPTMRAIRRDISC